MTTLVSGASGTVGRSLVEQLARAGEPVRAMTRDPAATRFPAGVEVVHGDLADPATLPGVLAGVERLHLFPPADRNRGGRPGQQGPASGGSRCSPPAR